MKRFMPLLVLVPIFGCKPPPTDADLARDMPPPPETFASEPLPSPETEGAVWARSAEEGRIIYGIPGKPALLALSCVEGEREDDAGTMRIIRLAKADEGAQALLALIGNGAIGRIAVDATEIGNRSVWQGDLAASDTAWEPLAGPRSMTVTVPGAGIVSVNPSPLPEQLLGACRASAQITEPAPPASQE
ncbi:hypothetical protein [Erythrobacter rubeus]|uniref:Uncharacterized protein n=1 Tax=Erythrobacter rubeus TaxID=2760803 RepID=A0ABR8KS11_9SPHN|nr:hypothetical protein [Erythrobacter rubeus]MBD2841234.1 hypothetical protein [Erythrobacter rubeus]